MTALVFYTGPIINAGAPVAYRDKLLEGANGGVLGIFDLAYDWCYAGAAGAVNPVAGQAIKDIAESGNDGFVLVNGAASAAKLPSYAGGGFDFTNVTSRGSVISFPARITEHIAAQALQYFAEVAYVRLPTAEDWNVGATVLPLSCYTTASGGFTAEPDLLSVIFAVSGGNKVLRAVRTPSAGVYDQLSIVVAPEHFGKVCQVAYWRDAAGQHFRLRSASGVDQAVGLALGAKTTQVLTGKSPTIGVGQSFWGTTVGKESNFRVYRKFWEDLEMSGRSAADVIDADWQRVVERGVFI